MHFELQDVGRWWGKRVALKGVSLSIQSGERVALIGPSGSGKSTLLRLLGGALIPSEGHVLVNGINLQTLSPGEIQKHRATIGVIAQGGCLVPQLSVHRNVTAGRLAHWPWYKSLASMVWSMEKQQTERLLESVGLSGRQWDRTSILSGGQQQRVAIARALAGHPKSILADEATNGLDPNTAEEVVSLMLNRVKSQNLTFILSTHWVSLARTKVDRLIGIRDGEILFDRPTEELNEALLSDLYKGSRECR